jgi:hypothetical protein
VREKLRGQGISFFNGISLPLAESLQGCLQKGSQESRCLEQVWNQFKTHKISEGLREFRILQTKLDWTQNNGCCHHQSLDYLWLAITWDCISISIHQYQPAILFIYFFGGTRVELRASSLLGKWSTTWVKSQSFFVIIIFSDRFSAFVHDQFNMILLLLPLL